ncbi:uncharacterized protein LOC111246264 isoform X1 [Varroa destructor]|uniref:Uncharacterized protein n=1 Tax=Varroa destructor TaxID=109461 RepID=A0A7M7JFF8_VARDE|nr:uncharacterized protein LOC111246264 isoform X1 [Varroa destructor]
MTLQYRICDHFSNEHNIYKYPPCILSSESRDQTMWRTRIAFPVDLITIVSAGKKIINAKLLSQWRTFVLAVRSSKAGEAQLKQTLWNKLIGLMTHADGCIAEKKGDPNN